jgi:hypothetical protein
MHICVYKIVCVCVCVCALSTCMSVQHMCGWYPQSSEEALVPLELELWAAVSHHVDAGN